MSDISSYIGFGILLVIMVIAVVELARFNYQMTWDIYSRYPDGDSCCAGDEEGGAEEANEDSEGEGSECLVTCPHLAQAISAVPDDVKDALDSLPPQVGELYRETDEGVRGILYVESIYKGFAWCVDVQVGDKVVLPLISLKDPTQYTRYCSVDDIHAYLKAYTSLQV